MIDEAKVRSLIEEMVRLLITYEIELTTYQTVYDAVHGRLKDAGIEVDLHKMLAERLEIPKLTFQILRRTMATQAQRMGSVKDIQAHLRHSRADTTANEYMQELPEIVKQMVGSVYAMLTKPVSSETESANLLPNATNRENSSPVNC